MRARERIDAPALRAMRDAIKDADGREILIVATLNSERMVHSIEVLARGHHAAVNAPRQLCERGQLIIHNHPSGDLSPSDADLAVAADLAEQGIGSAIVDNAVDLIHVVVEPILPAERRLLDPDAMAAALDAGGAVASLLPDYAPRGSQVEMTRLVARALNEERVAVAEAGTGVGKSFAYLIPAMHWVATNEQRICIATATINLQHQLDEKDCAFLQRALGLKVRAVVVKGRGNYLCRKRLHEQIGEAELFASVDPMLGEIAQWAEITAEGSRSDLPYHVPEILWNTINSDPDSCNMARCPNRERCFVGRARARAAAAQILIANHHLVFSDLAIRSAGVGWETAAILPSYQHLIFDEAHNLEQAATSHFSRTFTVTAARKHLIRLERSRRGHQLGLLYELRAGGADDHRVNAAVGAVEAAKDYLETVNAQALIFLGEESSWRATPATSSALVTSLAPTLVEMQRRLLSAADEVMRVLRSVPEEQGEELPTMEARAAVRRIEDLAAILEIFGDPAQHGDTVVWLERHSRDLPSVRFVLTPLHIRTQMIDAVYRPFESVVCTSATLTVKGSFEFWADRIGFPVGDAETLTGQFASPFDYRQRVLVAVPDQAPNPDRPEYNRYLAQLIPAVVTISRGSALVLFTAYRQLEIVYEAVRERLEADGYTVYRQGTEDRARLLAKFRTDLSSVLFATDSFWEGVDAPGDTLRLVIVAKLPFRVPTEPVQLARSEALDAAGGDSFYQFSLPQAATKLKQGFGRLMRRTDDYGAVVVADPRIVRKPYGRVFWDSLPETQRAIGAGEQLLEQVREFFGRFEQ